jgi:hypothetical protein
MQWFKPWTLNSLRHNNMTTMTKHLKNRSVTVWKSSTHSFSHISERKSNKKTIANSRSEEKWYGFLNRECLECQSTWNKDNTIWSCLDNLVSDPSTTTSFNPGHKTTSARDPVHPGHKTTSGRDPPKWSIRSKTQTWNQHGSLEKLANLYRKQHVSAHADVRNLSLVTSFGFKSKNLRRIEMIDAPQR